MPLGSELSRWLESLMLDEARMEAALRNVDDTFAGFNLTDDEKAFLRNPNSAGADETFRPMIIRNINSFNKENTSMIAIFSDQSRKFNKIINQIIHEKFHGSDQYKLNIANLLIDYIHDDSVTESEFRTPSVDKCDIRIVGLGMRSVDQLTREARRALKGCTKIFVVDSSPGIQSYLGNLGADVVDLSCHYDEGKDRLVTYIEMAKDVIAAAIEGGPVAFGLYGHPTVFAYPPFVIKSVAESCGLSVGVVPGISAMDCIFAELMIDPATDGMQMFEATDVVVRKRTLLTDVQTLIWQIGALETGLYSKNTSTSKRYDRFLSHLLKFFPEDHQCAAIFVSDNPLIPSIIYRFKLIDIGAYADKLHGGFTLHLPPVASARVQDHEALRLLKSREHLAAMTKAES